ncbi:MAG: hypothetical protein AB8G11_14935 [Saprospiraceae bacterium]
MKQIILVAIAVFSFQAMAFAQTNALSISNYSATAAPQSFLSTDNNLNKSSRGFFNIYLGGFGVRNEAKDWGVGGQVDAVVNLGRKISVGALGNVQRIGEDRYTPVVAYGRLNLTKRIGIQGGYGWYMNDFDYDFGGANNGYYGGLLLGGNRLKIEVGGYFPENQDYRVTVGLKMRLFKM